MQSRWLFCFSEMVFQAPLYKASRQLLLSMFYLRGLIYRIKDLHFMGVILSATLILVSCNQCTVNEVQNLLEFETCRPNRGNFDSFSGAFDGKIIDSDLVLGHSNERYSHEDACPSTNSFWFLSTLTGFLVNDAESEALDASGVQPEGFSWGLTQRTGNLSQSCCQGIIGFWGGRSIACSFSTRHGFPPFPSSDRSSKRDQPTDVSSCTSPLNKRNRLSSKSMENTETTNPGFLDGLSKPPVEGKPSILDWGRSSDIYSIGRWRKNSSLFESLDEAFHLKEMTAWISISSRNTFCFHCHTCRMGDPNEKIMLGAEDWSIIEREVSQQNIAMRSAKNWVFGPRTTEINITVRGIFFSQIMQPPSEIKAMGAREVDELVLRKWKSEGIASSMSVLHKNELLFSKLLVGNCCSEWSSVRSPVHELIVMEVVLNSGEVDSCEMPGTPRQHSSSSNVLVGKKSMASMRYGFPIAKDSLVEVALVHPYGHAKIWPWRSSALIRNNLTGIEWLLLQGFGSLSSLLLVKGNDPVQSLEFQHNFPASLNVSFLDALQHMTTKTPSCCQYLTKEVNAKNVGDLLLEVVPTEISGAECVLDGFTVGNGGGFSLQFGESVCFCLSNQSDLSAAAVHSDLQLASASGLIVIPRKASIPSGLLYFWKRSLIWVWFWKAVVVILSASLLVLLLFSHKPTFLSQDIRNSLSYVTCTFISLHAHVIWKTTRGATSQLNGFLRRQEEALLTESDSRWLEGLAPNQELVNPPAGHLEQAISSKPETNSVSAQPSGHLSSESFDTQDSSDSWNLRVRVGKGKGRRRRKKKGPGAGASLSSEVSSSHSSNSTPSSPLSPVTSTATKRPSPMFCATEQHMEAQNPFSEVSIKQSNKSTPSTKDNHLTNPMGSGNKKHPSAFAQGKPGLMRRIAAGIPSTDQRTIPHSPLLVPKSTMDPIARAPGSKIHCRLKSRQEENIGGQQLYTYDIWGDHLFERRSSYLSKVVSGMSSSTSASGKENNWESFFVRDPQSLISHQRQVFASATSSCQFGGNCQIS